MTRYPCKLRSSYLSIPFPLTVVVPNQDMFVSHLPTEKHGHLIVSLNPPSSPSVKHAFSRYPYKHPVLSTHVMSAQRRLMELNARAVESGRHRTFAGAWSHRGFHEDGFTAGLRAAAVLPGVDPPFAIIDADVELGELRASVIAPVFDMLNAMRIYFVLTMLSLMFPSVVNKVD